MSRLSGSGAVADRRSWGACEPADAAAGCVKSDLCRPVADGGQGATSGGRVRDFAPSRYLLHSARSANVLRRNERWRGRAVPLHPLERSHVHSCRCTECLQLFRAEFNPASRREPMDSGLAAVDLVSGLSGSSAVIQATLCFCRPVDRHVRETAFSPHWNMGGCRSEVFGIAIRVWTRTMEDCRAAGTGSGNRTMLMPRSKRARTETHRVESVCASS